MELTIDMALTPACVNSPGLSRLMVQSSSTLWLRLRLGYAAVIEYSYNLSGRDVHGTVFG